MERTEIPAPAGGARIEPASRNRGSGLLLRCNVDGLDSYELNKKLKSMKLGWGDGDLLIVPGQDETVEFADVEATYRIIEPASEKVEDLARRAASNGYLVFYGKRRVILLDAHQPERVTFRDTVCD